MKKLNRIVALTALPAALVLSFQNCGKVSFQQANESSTSVNGAGGLDGSSSTVTLTTPEDVALKAKVESAASTTGKSSKFISLSSPSAGAMSGLNAATGEFVYTPKSHFFGADQFQFTEQNDGLTKPLIRTVIVNVGRVGQPSILSDVFNFNMNTFNNSFEIKILDLEADDAAAYLSSDAAVAMISTANGAVSRTASGFSYTPNKDFRGTDKVKIFVRDGRGGTGSKDIKLIVGNPLQAIQPGMAVRAGNCIQCHSVISSNFVTDFGFGNGYFFAHDKGAANNGDWIYSMRMASDSGSKAYYPDWILSAAFANGAQLIVPKADLGFKYADIAPSWVDKTASWLQSTTLADLMTQIQLIKGSTFKATVVEKSLVYIGAPSVAQIKTAGQLDASHPVQYWKDSDISYDLSGLTKNAAGYYTNSGVLSCDGDLFVDGTVFLNTVTIKTISGCRLHVTGPVFVQKGITYQSDATLQANPNLQIISARAIAMGLGNTQCEANTDKNGWYNQNKVTSPLQERFSGLADSKDVKLRNTDSTSGFPMTSASPSEEAKALVAEGLKIADLNDASCHGRAVSFDRLMLVAPQVHSRYKGNFSGVVIAEFPLFSLGSFVYQFDQVFLKVPVLPLMDMDKILKIQ